MNKLNRELLDSIFNSFEAPHQIWRHDEETGCEYIRNSYINKDYAEPDKEVTLYKDRKNNLFICEYGEMSSLHRVLYTNEYGRIPRHKVITTKCNLPHHYTCVNPEHLVIASLGYNNLKLTDQQVRAIFSDIRPVKTIMAEYGITRDLVYKIKSGKRRASATQQLKKGISNA